jgi:hypothetical protein
MSAIYVNGKAVKPKSPRDKHTKADFIRRFACNLRFESIESGLRLKALEHAGKIPVKLIKPISDFYASIFSTTEPTKLSHPRISRQMQDDIRSLTKIVEDMKLTMSSVPIGSSRNKILMSELNDICEASTHFIQQFERTMDSFKTGVLLPFPPTDWVMKYVIEGMIEGYRHHVNSDKYPPYKLVTRVIESGNLFISEKMYRNYTQQHKKGTYYNLVH